MASGVFEAAAAEGGNQIALPGAGRRARWPCAARRCRRLTSGRGCPGRRPLRGTSKGEGDAATRAGVESAWRGATHCNVLQLPAGTHPSTGLCPRPPSAIMHQPSSVHRSVESHCVWRATRTRAQRRALCVTRRPGRRHAAPNSKQRPPHRPSSAAPRRARRRPPPPPHGAAHLAAGEARALRRVGRLARQLLALLGLPLVAQLLDARREEARTAHDRRPAPLLPFGDDRRPAARPPPAVGLAEPRVVAVARARALGAARGVTR